jgi:hypothetical protein
MPGGTGRRDLDRRRAVLGLDEQAHQVGIDQRDGGGVREQPEDTREVAEPGIALVDRSDEPDAHASAERPDDPPFGDVHADRGRVLGDARLPGQHVAERREDLLAGVRRRGDLGRLAVETTSERDALGLVEERNQLAQPLLIAGAQV